MLEIKSCKILYEFVGYVMINGVLSRDPIYQKDGKNYYESGGIVGGQLSKVHGGYTEIRIGYIPFLCQWASEALEAIAAVLIEYLLNKRNVHEVWIPYNFSNGNSFNVARCGRRWYVSSKLDTLLGGLRKRRWWVNFERVKQFFTDNPGELPSRDRAGQELLGCWVMNERRVALRPWTDNIIRDADQLAACNSLFMFDKFVRTTGGKYVMKSWYDNQNLIVTLCVTYEIRSYDGVIQPGFIPRCIVSECTNQTQQRNGMCNACYAKFMNGATCVDEDGKVLLHDFLLQTLKTQRAQRTVLVVSTKPRTSKYANGKTKYFCSVISCTKGRQGRSVYCDGHKTQVDNGATIMTNSNN
jgi:hypothetical protein